MLDASEIHARRLNAKEVLMPKEGEGFEFLLARSIQLAGRDQVFRAATENSERPRTEERGHNDDLQGESDGSQQTDDTDARGDFWSMSGDHIYRHDVQPRAKCRDYYKLDGMHQPGNACSCILSKVDSCPCTWTPSKWRRRSRIWGPRGKWKKHVHLEKPTQFLDLVYLECTQRGCKPNNVERRVDLHVPKERSFPIPLKYIDVVRRTPLNSQTCLTTCATDPLHVRHWMCCWKVALGIIGTLMVARNYRGHGPVSLRSPYGTASLPTGTTSSVALLTQIQAPSTPDYLWPEFSSNMSKKSFHRKNDGIGLLKSRSLPMLEN